MNVQFVAERFGTVYRGEVVDQATFETVARTGMFANEESAKKAAANMWVAKISLQEALRS